MTKFYALLQGKRQAQSARAYKGGLLSNEWPTNTCHSPEEEEPWGSWRRESNVEVYMAKRGWPYEVNPPGRNKFHSFIHVTRRGR
jgi:hypothetical protein